MKITVFGTGYVGLVQGSVLAEVGHDVLCVDVDAAKVAGLKAGRIPIYEPGLEDLVKKNHAEGRLNFTTDAAEGVAHGRIQFIAVGTPPDEDGSADLRYVLDVAATIARHMAEPKVVVTKSTVPVGTADKVRAALGQGLAARGKDGPGGLHFDVVSNPEFLKEGAAVADCMRPDRIVIGTSSPEAEELLREVYAPFSRNHEKIIVMDVRSAELTKYAANCMLATKISFMNEMANLAERLGADIEMVRQGIGSDQRIGYHFIYPGAGYGGSCFPKDVKALIATAREVGFEPAVLQAVEDRNDAQKSVIFEKLRAHYQGRLAGRTFALWGLAFKPQTDDMREAASRVVMEALWAAGARVQAFDPEAMEEAQRIYGDRDDLTLCGTKEAALRDADALVVMTEWQAFRAPDFDLLKEKLKAPVIFDGRNLYDPARMARRGFAYYAIGRGRAQPPAAESAAESTAEPTAVPLADSAA
jgi:UDPglucose 6-dehydrogenase